MAKPTSQIRILLTLLLAIIATAIIWIIAKPVNSPKTNESVNTADSNGEYTEDNVNQDTEMQTYTSDSKLLFKITNTGYALDSSESKLQSFTLNYPNDWILESTVFNDKNEKKVAEFSPGLVSLTGNQSCTDTLSTEEDRNSYIPTELISAQSITLSNNAGTLEITKLMPEDNEPSKVWYPHSYCIMLNEEIAFLMTFYEYSLEEADFTLFESILSTVKLN